MERILFVDDDPNVLQGIRRQLYGMFDLDFASDGQAALTKIDGGETFAVVVADMRMPSMSGTELLKTLAREHPGMVRIMLTGNSNEETAIEATNDGQVFKYLRKPCNREVLKATLEGALRKHREERQSRDMLDRATASAVKNLLGRLKDACPTVYHRSRRVQALAHGVMKRLGLADSYEADLAVLLADVGWITAPDGLVEKVRTGATLSDEERAAYDALPEAAAGLVAEIPRLGTVARIISQQNIAIAPIESRLVRVLHALLPIDRPYLPDLSCLVRTMGDPRCFDQRIVDAVAAEIEETVREAPVLMRHIVTTDRAGVAEGDVVVEQALGPDGSTRLVRGRTLNHADVAMARDVAAKRPVVTTVLVERLRLGRTGPGEMSSRLATCRL